MYSSWDISSADLRITRVPGEVVWSRRAASLGGSRGIAALADGSIVAAADNCSWVARFDAAGNELWRTGIDPDGGFAQSKCEVLPFTDATGVSGVALVNTVQLGGSRYPAVAFVHDDGTFGLMKSYAGSYGGGAHGAQGAR